MKHTHIALGALAIGLACALAAARPTSARRGREGNGRSLRRPSVRECDERRHDHRTRASAPGAHRHHQRRRAARSGQCGDTDERGAFLLPRIPPSGYTLTATKPGYLPGAYGAQTAGRPGTTISLSPAAVVTATIALTKGAALTGVVRDEHGMPVSDVPIIVLEAGNILTQKPPPPRESHRTRHAVHRRPRGLSRVWPRSPLSTSSRPSLPPIGLGRQPTRSERGRNRRRAGAAPGRAPGADASDVPASASGGTATFAPVFYPSTASAFEAARVKVGAGEERAGLDILLRAQTTRTLTGVVSAPGCRPASGSRRCCLARAGHTHGLAS